MKSPTSKARSHSFRMPNMVTYKDIDKNRALDEQNVFQGHS